MKIQKLVRNKRENLQESSVGPWFK